MNGQLKKGVLELCILFEVSKKKPYGYEILKVINRHFPEVDQSTVYAILRRLNSDGYTEVFLDNTSNGPQRKYYRITPKGNLYLESGMKNWDQLCQVVSELRLES